MCLSVTQGVALGYGEIGLSARIICVLTHPPPTDCRSYIEINMTHTLSYELEVSDEPSEEN